MFKRKQGLSAVLTVVLLVAASGCSGDEETASEPSATSEAPREAASTSEDTTTTEEVTEPEPVAWEELELSLLAITDQADLVQPIALAARPDDDNLWVLEREGRVRLIERSGEGDSEEFILATTPVLDISDNVTTEGEGALGGLAFSPDGDLLYLHYTDGTGDTVVSELAMGATTANRATERAVFELEQPENIHNGGDLAFGPDGHLYIGLGDGGGQGDPRENGQDTTTLHGSLLRIDPTPSGSDPYTVPADNPFASRNDAQHDEIWAWGLRNPWRYSFDTATGDLWIGDVGQDSIEEVDYLPATPEGAGRGANLGWNWMEGNNLVNGAAHPPTDHVAPIHTYQHENDRCAVTGGYVYRGSLIPELDGIYVFADFCTGEVFGLERTDDSSAEVARLHLEGLPSSVISFGEGPGGELYVLEQSGIVSRIQPADAAPDIVASQ